MNKQKKSKANDAKTLVIALGILFVVFGGGAFYAINSQPTDRTATVTDDWINLPTINAQITGADGQSAMMSLDVSVNPGDSDLSQGELAPIIRTAAENLNLSQVNSAGNIAYIEATLAQAVSQQTGQTVSSLNVFGILTTN